MPRTVTRKQEVVSRRTHRVADADLVVIEYWIKGTKGIFRSAQFCIRDENDVQPLFKGMLSVLNAYYARPWSLHLHGVTARTKGVGNEAL